MPLSLSCTDVQFARATEEQHELKKVDVTATAEEKNMILDNPSTASKIEEKVEPHIDVIFYHLRKKAKLQTPEQYRYITGNYLYKVYINNAYDSPAGLPWHLVDEVYIPINCGDEFHWVLADVVLKERHIRVYDSMSRRRRSGPSSEVQKLAKILPTYLDMSGFLNQKGLWSFCCRLCQVFERWITRYAALLWKYGEAKAQKSYATDVKDPPRPKPNFILIRSLYLESVNVITYPPWFNLLIYL
ncbi:hypothetical protein BC332_09833 [Capsicum chinense]|nr:hypothetical protein BC332_09833 [Capsicum chinense]